MVEILIILPLPSLDLAYLDDGVVSDLSPVYSKFSDISGDGLGDLVVLEKFTDPSGKIIPRIRYFEGVLSESIFSSAQELSANINMMTFFTIVLSWLIWTRTLTWI